MKGVKTTPRNKGIRTDNGGTGLEVFTTPQELEEEQESEIRILRQRRCRVKSDTEALTAGKIDTPHRKDLPSAKRRLESLEEKEEIKNRRKLEAEEERKREEERLIEEFKKGRRLTRTPEKKEGEGKEQITQRQEEERKEKEGRGMEGEKIKQQEDGEKGSKEEARGEDWKIVMKLIEKLTVEIRGLKEIEKGVEKEVKETRKATEENREMYRKMEERYNQLEKRTSNLEGELDRKMLEIKKEKRKEKEEEEEKIKNMRKEVQEIEREMERTREREEREGRRNNIIITGIEQEIIKERRDLERWIKDKIGVEINIKRIWKTKKKDMIGAECKDREQKEEIMKRKGERLRGEEVYITHKSYK